MSGVVNGIIDFENADQTITSYLSNGYALSSDNPSLTDQQLTPATYTVDGKQVFTVNLVHRAKSVTTTKESKKVTRTIFVRLPKGEVETITQTATISRLVATDDNTGEKTYGDWSVADWPTYIVPTVDGYTPSQTSVNESTVNGNSTDVSVDVTYQDDPQVATVSFIDQTSGATLETINLTGQSSTTMNFTQANAQLAEYLKQGYELAGNNENVTDNQLIPSQFDQDSQTDQSFKIYLVHQTKQASETKTITRTINVQKPDGTTTTIEQPVILSRIVTTDLVTGVQTKGDWPTGEWDNYQVPTVDGYTPSQSAVGNTSLDSNTTDQTIDVIYQANPQMAQVTFIDQTTGETIQKIQLSGQSNDTIDFISANKALANFLNHGYVIDPEDSNTTSDQLTPASYDQNDNADQSFNVYLVHQTSEATESQIVTRTIQLHLPNGSIRVVQQPAILTQTVTTDLVTEKQTTSEWTTASWPEYSCSKD